MNEFANVVIAGWTGRDEAALRKHIRELEEIGVKPPKTTPIFYRVAANLLTTASAIQVSGADTSGEVEFVLLHKPDGLWVTVGSDHTDRKAETLGVSLSKQLCEKPIAKDAWRYDEVQDHWERLVRARGRTASSTRKAPSRSCARPRTCSPAIRVAKGQLASERQRLLRKLARRPPALYRRWPVEKAPTAHSLFAQCPGAVESWERVAV